MIQDFMLMSDCLTVLNHNISTSEFQRVLPGLTTPGCDVTGRAQTDSLHVVKASKRTPTGPPSPGSQVLLSVFTIRPQVVIAGVR